MVFLYPWYIADDHPAVEFLHDLETTVYHVNEISSYSLRRCIMQDILRWADMQKCHLRVGVPYVLWFHFSDTTS